MAELSPALVAELDRLSPAEPTHRDWLDVRRRARPRRRTHAVAIAAALVAAAVPALAFSSGVRALLGLHPGPVVAKARVLVSAPIGNGYWVHFLEGPSYARGWCTFAIVDHRPAFDRNEPMNGGGGCSPRGTHLRWLATKARPLVASASYARGIPIYVTGVVARPLHATRVSLVWARGSRDLVLRRSYFAGGTAALSFPTRFEIVAYDGRNRVVATKRLELR